MKKKILFTLLFMSVMSATQAQAQVEDRCLIKRQVYLCTAECLQIASGGKLLSAQSMNSRSTQDVAQAWSCLSHQCSGGSLVKQYGTYHGRVENIEIATPALNCTTFEETVPAPECPLG